MIGAKQMNIKMITLMDFDWNDFIGAMKINIRAHATRLPNITTFNDGIFKLQSLVNYLY